MPSLILLIQFAYGSAAFGGPVGGGISTGLKIVAVAIIAQAVWGMARNLCPDREETPIALGAVLIIILVAGAIGQVAAIAAGAATGLLFCRNHHEAITQHIEFPVSMTFGAISLVLFFALLFGLPIIAATASQWLAVFDSFYRASLLVLGGGHGLDCHMTKEEQVLFPMMQPIGSLAHFERWGHQDARADLISQLERDERNAREHRWPTNHP